ncbi:MAG: M23 family metallopeptidase [Gemmatimonadetes bacterium]|nr:M23 family metallopeptidase [Gemmatimonadota bacterium]
MLRIREICALSPAAFLLAVGCHSRLAAPATPEPATPAPNPERETVPADRQQEELPALPPTVIVTPQEIFEGTAFLLHVRPAPESAPVIAVDGMAAERTLAFVASADGRMWTVAPAPLDAREVDVQLTIRYPGGAERTETLRVPILPREFSSEILTVPERFTNPPPEARPRIESEHALVAETVRRVTSEALWREAFARPREDRSSSRFGTRRMFNGELQSRHLGYDIAGRIGDPVRASNSGRVALARDLYFSGNTVYLDHGLGLYTAYMHMSEALVQEGDWVDRGQVVGRVGATGRVTGAHLHWSVSFQGIPLDPETLLSLGAPPPTSAAPPAGARP